MLDKYALINSPLYLLPDEDDSFPADNEGEYNIEDEDDLPGDSHPAISDDIPDDETGEYGEETQEYDEEQIEDEDDDDEDDSGDEYDDDQKQPSPIRLLIELMLNPIDGWKRIRRAQMKVDYVARNCFLPLIGICALSCLLKCLYHASVSLSESVLSGVKIFVALYLGNFLSLLFVKILMPRRYKKIADSNFGKQFVLLLISTLAVFFTIYQCLPMLGPLFTFLPLWTIYLAMRGCRFFHFETEKNNLLTTLICMAIIFGPLCVYWAFDLVL